MLLACQNPSSSTTAQQLLHYGADARAVDQLGNTALHLAADPPLVRALIASGAAVNASNQAGLTPLHLAVRHTTSRNEIVSLLAQAGCQLDQPTPLGIYSKLVYIGGWIIYGNCGCNSGPQLAGKSLDAHETKYTQITTL